MPQKITRNSEPDSYNDPYELLLKTRNIMIFTLIHFQFKALQ